MSQECIFFPLVSPIVPAPTKCTALEVVAKPKVNVEEFDEQERKSLAKSYFHILYFIIIS